jgi:hypothetical protein
MTLFGKDAVLYWSEDLKTSTDDADSLDWVEQDNIIDLTDNFSPTDVDTTTRATAKTGWEASETVTNSGEIRFGMQVKHGNAFVTAIFNAFINKTKMALMDMSAASDVEGAFGLAANFSVALTHGKPVKGVQVADVTLKISSFPEWIAGTSS